MLQILVRMCFLWQSCLIWWWSEGPSNGHCSCALQSWPDKHIHTFPNFLQNVSDNRGSIWDLIKWQLTWPSEMTVHALSKQFYWNVSQSTFLRQPRPLHWRYEVRRCECGQENYSWSTPETSLNPLRNPPLAATLPRSIPPPTDQPTSSAVLHCSRSRPHLNFSSYMMLS